MQDRLSVTRIAIAAATLGILVEAVSFPFLFAGSTAGLGWNAMNIRFLIDILMLVTVLSMLIASRCCLGRVLLSTALFAVVFMLSAHVLRFALLEPDWELGTAVDNGLGMVSVGIIDGLTALLLAIVPGLLLAKLSLRSRSLPALLRRGVCWRCGYNLTGLPESSPCPECNTGRETGWPRKMLAFIGLGESQWSRRTTWLLAGLAAIISGAAITRLICAEVTQPPGVQIAAGIPSIFAEPGGSTVPTIRLGKGIDVSDQFGLADPYKLLLVLSLAREPPPRAQLLLMHSAPAFGGVGSTGIAFGELTQAEAAEIEGGGAPARFGGPISNFCTLHTRSGRRIGPVKELWQAPGNE